MKKLSKIIYGVLIYWICFVVLAWAAFFIKDSVPDSLIQYGLGGGAIELVAGAFIEIAKKLIERKYGLMPKGDDSNDYDSDISFSADDTGSSEQSTDSGNQGGSEQERD